MSYRRIASMKTAEQFRSYCNSVGASFPFDETLELGAKAPLQSTINHRGRIIGNRFCILPMEGWDGTADGRPTELTVRRWENFGRSGAKLIWGGEAIAVRHDGRANPNQLWINETNLAELSGLREKLVATHEHSFGTSSDLFIGLQLTHSGRYARPNEKAKSEPAILYRHPILDARLGISSDATVMSDDDIRRLIDDFVRAARLAAKVGFDFVDIKHCHGYLGHEFLSAIDRPGLFGGELTHRTRFLAEIVQGIRAEAPGLDIGVRLSAFDFLPFKKGPDEVGVPEAFTGDYRYAFGGSKNGLDFDLTTTFEFLEVLQRLDISLLCVTCGSPYYNPHIQRPALFPPSDGYQPPEDPLVGVARQIRATAAIKERFPEMIVVGSGYSYLQEWLPNVGQSVIRNQQADSIGLGRMVLSYPELPADVLAGRPLERKRICRTFSDCTTAPRKGLVSGCYPLDPYYKARPEAKELIVLKGSDPPVKD